jgi:endonuclease/exonuclease/phosphatase (EEP) superfamily protein YafD
MFKRCCYFTGIFIFGLLAVIALAATIIPIFPSKEWYFRVFDYPRLQTFFIAVLALAWYAVFYFKRGRRSYIFVAMFVIVIVVQCYKALPYTPLGNKQVLWSEKDVNDTSAISLLICNVLQPNTSYEKVIAKVNQYQPDIFVTTESDSVWQKGLSAIENKYPYRVPVPISNTYGLHLYSRLPLKETSVRFLMEPDIPSIRTRVQLHSGEWITLFLVHPRPPVPGEASDSKERDGEIIMVAKEARKEKGAVIVAGDFNDVAWSATTKLFQQVSGFLDPRRGRGFYCTFNAKIPVFRWPLDHVFHSSHFKLLKMERAGNVNSDHFPMFIKLSYEPDEKLSQPKVKPEADTEKKANEAIEKGKNDKDAPGQ